MPRICTLHGTENRHLLVAVAVVIDEGVSNKHMAHKTSLDQVLHACRLFLAVRIGCNTSATPRDLNRLVFTGVYIGLEQSEYSNIGQ